MQAMRHIVDVGRRADDRMHQPRLGIHADVRLHAEVPLLALLGLMHLGVALAVLVLRRTRRGNEGGVHHRAGLEHQALLGQPGVDGGQQLGRQLVLLQQVAKAKDGGLVGHARGALQAGKAAVQRALVQFLFHGRIAQVPPQLQAMDAQHRLDGKRRPATQRLVCTAGMRLDQRHQLRPRHHLVHLVEEDLLAGLLGQRVKAERDLIHSDHRRPRSRPAPVGLTRGFANCP